MEDKRDGEKRLGTGARDKEIVQLVKYLPCKHKDLSSYPNSLIKAYRGGIYLQPNAAGVKTSISLQWPANLANP